MLKFEELSNNYSQKLNQIVQQNSFVFRDKSKQTFSQILTYLFGKMGRKLRQKTEKVNSNIEKQSNVHKTSNSVEKTKLKKSF